MEQRTWKTKDLTNEMKIKESEIIQRDFCFNNVRISLSYSLLESAKL